MTWSDCAAACVVIVVSSYHALSHGCYVLTSTGQRGWEILDTASQKVIMRNTMHDDTRFMFRLHTEWASNFVFRFDYRWIHLDQVDPENQISKNESNVTERYDILYECDIWCTMRILMLLHLSLAWVSKRTVSSMDGIAYAVPAMQNAESRWPALGNDAIPGRAQEPGQHVAIVPWIRSGGVVDWTNDTPARNAWSWVLFWVVITITCVALMFIIMLMILRGHHTTNGPARLTPYFTIIWNEILAKSSTVQSMNGGVSDYWFSPFLLNVCFGDVCVDVNLY